MDIMAIAKLAVDVVVTTGVGAVVGNAIKASTPLDAKIIQKISIGVGGLVLSSMAGNAAARYTEGQIDSTVNQIREVRTTFSKK